ncbi:hypothetical protein OTU49_009984 [Cherax quadricarinatus]|uniref:Uncharacterized protein n=1 Tax=Cherax quadricarinatus TaxID=27406 RepID=A0AAW0W9Y9_CHEQU
MDRIDAVEISLILSIFCVVSLWVRRFFRWFGQERMTDVVLKQDTGSEVERVILIGRDPVLQKEKTIHQSKPYQCYIKFGSVLLYAAVSNDALSFFQMNLFTPELREKGKSQ